MLYELRVYDTVPGRLPALHKRFVEHTLRIWPRHGIKPVAFWEEVVGRNNRLVYILQWENMAEREKKWATFQADQEWVQARAESEKDGPIVAVVENRFMAPTPYSPMQ